MMNFKVRRMKVKIKYKNVNKLWQKLSNMSINAELDLKAGFVWEKKKCITASEISSISMFVEVWGRIFFRGW